MQGLNDNDRKITQELEELIKEATQDIEAYEFSQAFDMIYEFVWHRLADWYIEAIKDRLKNEDTAAFAVLRHTFLNCLKLLHPFMPFATEALWKQIPKESDTMLIISKWPL
jgi:valyl-tRNA synthetase